MKRAWAYIKTNPIAGAIFTSVLFAFIIEPLVKRLSDNLPSLFNEFTSGFINAIYQRAAHTTSHTITVIFCAVVLGLLSSGLLFGLRNPRGNRADFDIAPSQSIDNELKKLKRKIIFAWIFSVLLLIVIMVLAVSYVIFPVSLRSSFEITLDLVGPYTTDEVVKELKSKWVQMDGYIDFKAINDVLLDIRNAAEI